MRRSHDSVQQAVEVLGEKDWYLSEHPALPTDGIYSQVTFIRGLSETLFDPIAETDVINPEVQQKTWEKIGLFFASGKYTSLMVIDGPVPVPIV